MDNWSCWYLESPMGRAAPNTSEAGSAIASPPLTKDKESGFALVRQNVIPLALENHRAPAPKFRGLGAPERMIAGFVFV